MGWFEKGAFVPVLLITDYVKRLGRTTRMPMRVVCSWTTRGMPEHCLAQVLAQADRNYQLSENTSSSHRAQEIYIHATRCTQTPLEQTSLFCWVSCHLHLRFRASLSKPWSISACRDFRSIRSRSWNPHIPAVANGISELSTGCQTDERKAHFRPSFKVHAEEI